MIVDKIPRSSFPLCQAFTWCSIFTPFLRFTLPKHTYHRWFRWNDIFCPPFFTVTYIPSALITSTSMDAYFPTRPPDFILPRSSRTTCRLRTNQSSNSNRSSMVECLSAKSIPRRPRITGYLLPIHDRGRNSGSS